MRKTAEETEKTRQAILKAAARIFARIGIDRSTLEQIAMEAGITRGAIYWHFKDKMAIFDQIMQTEAGKLDQLIETALNEDPSPLRKLKKLLQTVVDNFYDNEGFRQQIFMTWYRLNPSMFEPQLRSKSQFVQQFLAVMARLLAEARENGEIDERVDPRMAAYHLSCLINGFYRLYHVAPDWAHEKELTCRLFADYFASIKKKHSNEGVAR